MSTVIIVPRDIDGISISAFLYEQHRSEATVTENAIEDGSDVHDHMYMKAKGLTLELVDEKASDAFLALVEKQALRKPFDIVSGLAVYTNVVIEAIIADREKNTSKVLRATVELKEVRIVGTKTTISTNFDDLPPTTGPSGEAKTFDQTAPTVERGDSQTNDVDGDKGSSILADLIL